MARKPIAPVFAAAQPAPAISTYAGAGLKVKKAEPPLPLANQDAWSIGFEWHLVTALVLMLLILVAYGNSFQSEWVLDNKYIIELDMPKAASWADAGKAYGVRNIFMQDYWWPKGISGLFRPISTFTYWLNWRFFGNGDNPTPREQVIGFHWVNLGVHFLNAFLFYILMLRLTKHFWVSFFASTVFATHPIATESVTNIIGRADMFAATCVVGGMLLYINFTRSFGWRRVGWLIALVLLTAFGMFSKESSIAVGAVIFFYDLIYRIGERIRDFDLRELILALARIAVMTPLFYFAVRIYLVLLVPWMSDMQSNVQFGFALTFILLGLVSLFLAIPLMSRRNFWLTSIIVAASSFLLLCMAAFYTVPAGVTPPGVVTISSIFSAVGLNIAAKTILLCGLGIFMAAFVAVEFCFAEFWPEGDADKPSAIAWRGFYDGYLALWPTVILMFTVRAWVFENATPAEEPFLDNPLRGLGFIAARLTAAKVAFLLLWKCIWPVTLSSDYSYNQIPLFGYHDVSLWQNFACVLSALIFIGIGLLAFLCWKKGQRAICFFICLYYINYLPTSNVPYIIGSIMAERFMYLPLIAFAAILVIVIDLLARRFFFPLDDSSDAPAEAAPPQRRLYRYVPHIILSVLTVGYGIRAFARNYDWHTDVTLWISAEKLSPLSFRSYQSLAFALFEQDPAGNCDRMIDVDEQGLKLVDDLPNPNNSSRLYLHLGMYYGLKGEMLSKTDSNGQMILTDAAKPWFAKSCEILERGIPIDRAFSEVNRGRDVKRGRDGNDTPDVGLAPVYLYLASSYMRLGLFDQAERTYRYMIHLEPTDADSYMKMANLQIQRGRLDDAAATLIDVILLDASRQDAWSLLNRVFQQINTEPQPCIIVTNGRTQLDINRVVVRQAILQGYREFVKYFIQAKRMKLAQDAANNAVKSYGFNRQLFDELFDPEYLKQFPIPVPADPMFYKPDKVRFALMMPEVQKAFIDATGNSKFDLIDQEIVEGRSVFFVDQPIDGKNYRIRISEEGKLLSKTPLN